LGFLSKSPNNPLFMQEKCGAPPGVRQALITITFLASLPRDHVQSTISHMM